MSPEMPQIAPKQCQKSTSFGALTAGPEPPAAKCLVTGTPVIQEIFSEEGRAEKEGIFHEDIHADRRTNAMGYAH